MMRRGKLLCAAVLVCVWIRGYAQADPGDCLHFNGTNGVVIVPHDPALDAFPITITAWIRTLRSATLYDGIVNKYSPGSGNGYTLHVYNGHVYAWYFRSPGNGVYPGDPGLDGGYVADGEWHHVAFVVTGTGGSLYVDGNLNSSLGWSGTSGATTTTAPILLGRYATNNATFASSFAGDIDEVTIWNRALSSSEVNYLKHRRLAGKEDGLLGYWRFDEGSGTAANNSATNAYNGTLSAPPPTWIQSQAAIALQPVATNCLKFDGVNGFVQVAHNTDLNAYPFTATAWFRTTNTSLIRGMVSKYRDASGDGWSIIVQSGLLRGFYYRQGTNKAIDFTYGVSVADGAWHHAAMTVDASGGKLWLDGVQVGSSAWQYGPGPPTSAATEPMQIGRYYTYTERFVGALDEVTVWNRALTAGEFQANRNVPLTGNETNLVGYWRLDEGSGSSTADSTSFGHTGTLVSNPAWTGSTAYLGDRSVHLVAAPGIPTFSRTYAIKTAVGIVPALGKNTFPITGRAFLRRFYDFGAAPASVAVTNLLDGGLQVSGPSTPIAVKPNTVTNGFNMSAYNASSPQPLVFGSVASLTSTLYVEPDGVNLDSINNLHEGVVTLSHSENSGAISNDGSVITDTTRLLHFNGHVLFGNIDTIVTNISNNPTPGSIFAPSYLQSQLQYAIGGAYLAASPSFTFGGGAAFTANLGVDGTATNVNGSFSLANPDQFFETAGIRYRLPGATLGPAGMIATNLEAWFPVGFGMQIETNNRVMLPYASAANVALTPSLLPTVSVLTFTATSYQTNRLYFAEETKPFFISAPQIEWHIPQGEFYIAQADFLQFVRQREDDDLDAQRPNLVVPLAADRISNDEYYRNVAATPGAPIYVRPDTNGAAWLTMQATLQESEYRPHFPYMNRNVGDHIPVLGGMLTISNSLVDPVSSYLSLGGPAPIPYARDCSPEAGCSVFATTGPQVLPFTAPVGHLGLGELKFTVDGGLLGYGSVPPTNLTWGYIGGAAFSQRTSDVQTGALAIAGTFLRGELSSTPDPQKAAALLFTGWGDETNSSYVERPDLASYNDGFANYPGLNFRAPATGRSFIAGQDTGPYPLTSRSKYYTRFGGVSGIHEAESVPNPNLALYGYPFAFLSYRLSFLDSDNRESRTDGSVSLPVPAGFQVDFKHLKFLCRGNLDTAELPPGTGAKHMVYWNTYITPLSLQFKPPIGDECNLSNRFLVLGVQMRVPLITNAFEASLGFEPSGNLVTAANAVEGVDSRFAVPATLQLQGPGGSFYTLTTAGDAYFNNWDTSGHPDAGFYNVVGRLRVPFFRDVKVHLHVTPTGETNSVVDIMGGWPAEEGLGADRGWNNGTQNYFNTAKFDPHADGWPVAQTPNIQNYRTSPDETYRPRAQRNWIDVAFFDYPLQWNAALREFEGFVDAPVTLPVIDVNSRLKQVTPGKVDFDFAQDLNIQLPHIKLLDLANDAINEFNTPINTLSNAIRSAVQQQIDTSGLTSGFRSLQTMMQENAEGFFRPVLDQPISNVVETLYPILSNSLAGGKGTLIASAAGIVAASSNGLQTAIQGINGTAAAGNTVFGQVNRTLVDVTNTINLFLRVLEKDGQGNRHIVRAIVEKLTQDQAPALAANFTDPIVDSLLSDLEPTLAQIESELRELLSQFDDVRQQVGRVGLDSDFDEDVAAANHDGAALQGYLQQAGAGVSNLLNDVVGPANDYFSANPAAAKQELRERLTIAFLSSPIPGKYQQTFRLFLYDKNFLLDQLMDVLFDQVNRSIRNGLNIAGAQDTIFQNLKGAGLLSQSLASAKITGAPTFEGDSLRSIHLDSDIRVNLPDEMHFTAYMDIKELNSATAAIGCIPPGAPAAEVTLGANDVPLDWAGVPSADPNGKPMTLSVAARWTLQSGSVKGIGGSLDIKGTAGFKGCEMSEIKAALAIGQIENYFTAQAKATVIILGVPVNFRAGMFAGHACSLDALKFVDPEAEQVVQQPGDFSGVYLEFGGGLSLSDILFGESSDLLDVRADITTALFYQGGPRFGRIGGRQKTSVDIKLLYVLEGSADWAVFVVLDTAGQLTVGGSADVCGRIGICPVCEQGCKGVTVKGVINDDGIDYFIDY